MAVGVTGYKLGADVMVDLTDEKDEHGEVLHYGTTMTDDKIRCPHCPWCGEPPQLVISARQAFCSSDDCPAFTWDTTKTAAWLLANVTEVDLQQGPEEKR